MSKNSLVLIIDDDHANRFLLEMLFDKVAGDFTFTSVSNGLEALNYLNDHPAPDLIFLDINMPVMNGWDFLDRYYSLPEDKKSEKLVLMITELSGGYTESNKRWGKNFVHLKKPITLEKLQSVL